MRRDVLGAIGIKHCASNSATLDFADWDMNFQNLSVMALRIIFLKLTGFNLLMTLRLWSS